MLGMEIDLRYNCSSLPVVSRRSKLFHLYPDLFQHLLHLTPLLRLRPHLLHYPPDRLLATAAAH